jgi:predicted PurR-regulated permease PerM
MAEKQPPTSRWPAVVALAVILWVAYYLRFVLLPFLLAAALAYIARPALGWLVERARWPRLAAVAAILLGYLAVFAGLGYWATTALAAQLRQGTAGAAHMLRQLIALVLGGPEAQVMGQTLRADQLANGLVQGAARWIGSPANAAEAALWVSAAITGTFLTFVLLFYFLAHGERLVDGAVWLIPPPRRPKIRALIRRADPMLGRYIRGLFVVVFVTAVLSWGAMKLVLGLPHATLLAIITALLELVPVIGPLTAATLVGMVAIRQDSLWVIGGFVVFYVAIRLLIDDVVGPVILGKAATLHPVVVIFSFLAGGVLYGLLGVLLAVPLAACVKIVLTALYEEQDQLAAEMEGFREG